MENDTTQVNNDTSTVDNSSDNAEFSQGDIAQALDEPTEKEDISPAKEQEPQKVTDVKDNIEKCPDKFKNEDGSINVGNILKSYKELEPLINEKAAWQKERAELLKVKEQLDNINKMNETKAQEAGYESARDMQASYELAYLEANEYAKYLQFTENPEEVREMLIEYANNPNPDLLEEIELEFAPEVNKRVAVFSDREKQKYEQQKVQERNTIYMAGIEDIISKSVDAHEELFRYEPFKNMFVNTLQKYGSNFTYEDAEVLMNTMEEMKGLFLADFEKQAGIKLQNKKATDALAALDNYGSAPAESQRITNSEIDNMSQGELSKLIRQYV